MPLRQLTQKRAAVLLAAGLIAVPAVPILAATATPVDNWAAVEPAGFFTVISANGHAVDFLPPDGWEARFLGNGIAVRSGTGAAIQLRLYDLEGRDPDAVTQRVMRFDRINGIHAALTAGIAESGDGALTGQRCTVVNQDLSGACAFLDDDEVMVVVETVGTAEEPGLPLDAVVASIGRSVSWTP